MPTSCHLLKDLADHLGVHWQGTPPSVATANLVRDSKEVTPGSVFFAQVGTRSDGHAFVAAAAAAGAIAAIVEREGGVPTGIPTLRVDSTRRAWAQAHALLHGQPTEKLQLVGITGTNGKTTSTFLLREAWQGLGISSGLIGTVCSYLGEERRESELTTPDASALQKLFGEMVARGIRSAVMEVSSIALDQFRTSGCRFHTGVFTNLTQDHLDYHKTFEGYYAAKLKLFQEYRLEVGVLNAEDPYAGRLRREGFATQWLSFSTDVGTGTGVDFFPLQLRVEPAGTWAKIQTPLGIREVRLGLIGRHNLANVLAVLAVAYGQGLDLDAVLQKAPAWVGAPGRLERAVFGAEKPNVFVDYAHSEDALRNVLVALRRVREESGAAPRGKLITVFGCGGDRDRTKRPKMAATACELSDTVIVTSDNPRTEDPESILDQVFQGIPAGRSEVFREVDRRKAIYLALHKAQPHDLVLIAGKGHETYQILGTQKVPFDDCKVVKEYYLGGKNVEGDSSF